MFNIVSLLSEEEIAKIISVDKTESSNTINIGKSIVNNANFYVPLDKFFNLHMAIFGNTGSGKSNILTKVYTELFRNYSTARNLEVTCKENMCFMWISDYAMPDHSTIHRFHQRLLRTNDEIVKSLLK